MWDIEVNRAHAFALIGHLPKKRVALWGSVVRDGWLCDSDIAAMTPGEQIGLLLDVDAACDALYSAVQRELVDELYRFLVQTMGADELSRRTQCENCHDELPITGGIHDPGQVGVLPRPPFFCDQNCLDQAAERRGSAAFQ